MNQEATVDAISTVLARMRSQDRAPALHWRDQTLTSRDLFEQVDTWRSRLAARGIGPGTVCGILGDYTPQSCALLFALMETRAILAPFSYAVRQELPALLDIAGVQHLVRFDEQDAATFEHFPAATRNDLVESFSARGTPGLIVFTSGSTGRPKGILHDCERVMRKFVAPRSGWRTVLFLMFDHFGGFNTLLSTFAYGGVGVCLPGRSTEDVCRAIEAARATLLPTTPTFLNLLLASGDYRRFDLSSIRLITYGTEVMPAATLERVQQVFPGAQVKQTYGLSELGVLRSKSEDDTSLWVKIGGDGFQVQVRDGLLWVRSEANMVGYLNAPNPFDDEGWLCTGDQVEVRGEYVRILGRQSDMINVGGQKVFPAEVEAVLTQAENIRDASVFGATHPLMGHVVHARVVLDRPEPATELTERLRRFCLERLARHKVPLRFTVVSEAELYSQRFKKVRLGDPRT